MSVELKALAGGTELSLVHDRFLDTAARDNHARGWQPCIDKLGELLQLQAQEA